MSVVATQHDQRRALIQAHAQSHFRRRVLLGRANIAMLYVALFIALIPLYSIVSSVLIHGIKVVTWSFLTTPQQLPTLFTKTHIGGISNAIIGSIVVDGLALVIAVPLSIVLSIALYESKGRISTVIQNFLEIMIGLPSILSGIFIFSYVVTPLGYKYTAYAGSLALALLMMPLMVVTCLRALNDVPNTLHEAALSLGARPSRIMWRVTAPYALPRMLTGILLSLSRAIGETAPILFIIGAQTVNSWSFTDSATTLPVMTYNYLGSQYPAQREACWGIAFVIIAAVFTLNLISRLVVARSSRDR